MGRRLLAGTLAAVGIFCCGQGLWIPAKACLAQILLERAWQRAAHGEATPRPWGWADTWPVARLTAPEQGEEVLVLAGASGSSLAFGPGHLTGSAAPGTAGNTVIAGHRDTHFAFLRHLQAGDEILLQTPHGTVHRYLVESFQVVDHHDTRALAPADDTSLLTLVTCYPFDALVPGGPLRYVVRAVEVEVDEQHHRPHSQATSCRRARPRARSTNITGDILPKAPAMA
jgi:sortase A